MKTSFLRLFARAAKNALVLFAVAGISSVAWADKINLNTADLEAMQYIPGIGQSKAELIIQAREKAGGFSSMEQVDAVPGIGETTMQDILKYGSLDSGVSELSDEMRKNKPLRPNALRQNTAVDPGSS